MLFIEHLHSLHVPVSIIQFPHALADRANANEGLFFDFTQTLAVEAKIKVRREDGSGFGWFF